MKAASKKIKKNQLESSQIELNKDYQRNSSIVVNNSNGPKVVLFDFGSVLRVRTAERQGIIEKLAEMLETKLKQANIEISVPKSEKPLKKLVLPSDWKATVGKGTMSREEGWLNGFAELGFTKFDDEMKQWVRDFVFELEFSGKEIMAQTVALLQQLKLNGVHLAILSNHSLELYDWLENVYNVIPDPFPKDLVIISSKIQRRKPSPEIFQFTLDVLAERIPNFNQEKHKSNIFFIDNKPENCIAAEKMGLKAFNYLHDPHKRLESFELLKLEILGHIRAAL